MITYPNLYHLQYFIDAVELSSISAAAQKNLVTHPAISRAITSLEKYFEIQLLEHQKKSFKVTSEGYKLSEQAKILLNAANDFDQLKLKNKFHDKIDFRIGISRSLTEEYLSPLLTKIKNQYLNVQVHISFGTTNQIIESVANNQIDLGLTIGTQALPSLNQVQIQSGDFILIEKKNNKTNKLSLEKKSIFLTEPRYETEKLKTEYKKHFKSDLLPYAEIQSWEVISHLIQKGSGVGLLPEMLIKNWNLKNYHIIKTPWYKCHYDIYLHQNKLRPLNRTTQFAIECIKSI